MKALISKPEDGRICEIRHPSEIFEVHESMFWIDVPDDVKPNTHIYDLENETFKPFPKETDDGTRFKCARGVAYGPIGDQLDMIYKELEANGTLSNTGEWFNHVKKVKQDVTRDNV